MTTISGYPALATGAKHAGLIFVIVLLWALFGIFTRPVGALAAFWAANAILLGLFLRLPSLATPLGWAAAILGYLTADMLTGSTLGKTLALTAGNMVGIVTGFLLYRRISPAHAALTQPLSVLIMVGVLVVASIGAGVVGMFVGAYFFGLSHMAGFFFWMTTELVNYIAILPVMLTMPVFGRRGAATDPVRTLPWRASDASIFVPFVAVILSIVAGALVGGPGAIAFPVPALLWSAITYSRFINALLAFLFTATTLIVISKGYLHIQIDMLNPDAIMSLRVGIMLIALAPLVVVSVMASREELLKKFQSLAITDLLTNVFNRAGFFQLATARLAELHHGQGTVAVLMIDIDHFKTVNDTYGHPAGDAVLKAIAAALKQKVRATDVIGRIGGEEFCMLVGEPDSRTAQVLAARLCATVRELSIVAPGDTALSATISIGVATADPAPHELESLIAAADRALYRAKREGRDRHILADQLADIVMAAPE